MCYRWLIFDFKYRKVEVSSLSFRFSFLHTPFLLFLIDDYIISFNRIFQTS